MSGSVNKSSGWLVWAAFALPVVLLVLSLNLGSYPIPLKAVWMTLTHGSAAGPAAAASPSADILFRVRLPRLLLALFAGAALAASGASLQALFQKVAQEIKLRLVQ